MTGDLWDNLAENGCIACRQVEPGLAWLQACSAGSDDGHCGTCAIGIVAGPDARGMGERNCVFQIHGLALGLGLVHVHQHDFSRQPAE